MSWDGLLADLPAAAAAPETAQPVGEAGKPARAEPASGRLTERLRSATGRAVLLRCRDGLAVSGTLSRVGKGWLQLDEGGGRQVVIVTAAVSSVAGLSRWSPPPESASTGSPPAGAAGQVGESGLELTQVLLGIARDRSGVRVHLDGGRIVDGTVDGVGEDFIEVAVHPIGGLRRRHEARQSLVVAMQSLIAVRRDA